MLDTPLLEGKQIIMCKSVAASRDRIIEVIKGGRGGGVMARIREVLIVCESAEEPTQEGEGLGHQSWPQRSNKPTLHNPNLDQFLTSGC
jgi:hypothetical protein